MPVVVTVPAPHTWLKCPIAFKLRYIDGIRSPTTSNLFLGKAVHAGLECFYRHRQVGVNLAISDVVRRLDACWEALLVEDNMTFASTGDENKLKQQAAVLIGAYPVPRRSKSSLVYSYAA